MSGHGAALQLYNQELVKCLEDLKEKRTKLQSVISAKESEKAQLEKRVKCMLDKLTIVNQGLNQCYQIRDKYDQAISETENGFQKILESSQALLNVAQHQAQFLDSNEISENGDALPLTEGKGEA